MKDDSMYDMVWPPPKKTDAEEKLLLMQDEKVKQIIFDALHMKREMFPDMNVGQHSDYKSIYEELIKTYENATKKEC
jgi:16S rRNA C1402 (ribose-2'-O) methylase RsmI